MRRSLILALICVMLGLIARADDDDGCTCEVHSSRARRSAEWGYGMASTLADSQTIRINALTKMVDELEEKLEENRGETGINNMLGELEAMVEKQETPLCDKEYHFSCGRGSGQCIAELLVCDGASDCDNGHDEDKSVCSNPVKPGTKWHGLVRWTGCTPDPENEVELMITGNKRYEWFPSRIKVKALVTVVTVRDGKQYRDEHRTYGSYSFGMREIDLEPKDKDWSFNVGVICKDGGANKADCRFISVGDMHECGRAVLTRDC